MTLTEWHQLLGDKFLVPGYPKVYVLGSFAKHVTLYSQQVRALNLIAGLVLTDEIKEDTEVVIVGGGAAGLTAAAAAAKHKAKVTVLEQLEGLMELQGNNRQRWLHPYIYDWPDNDPKQDVADLPFLRWKAAYAETVAREIEDQWVILQELWNIDLRQNAKYIQIKPDSRGSIVIRWTDQTAGRTHARYGPIIILAIGFGLEPQNEYGDSYWAEDNIDGSFRPVSPEQKWLVSGFGDGALTDLMRLCLRRFRHAEIATLFDNASGIDKVKSRLREIHAVQNASPAYLTKEFDELATTGQLNDLIQILEPRLRKQRPELFLVGRDLYPYGPNASILNRLIVCVLSSMNAFTLLTGPVDVKGIKRNGTKFLVPLGHKKMPFDRLILRHGPSQNQLNEIFNEIYKSCGDLAGRWTGLSIQEDITRKPQWPHDFYATSTAPTLVSTSPLAKFGVTPIQAVEKIVSGESIIESSSLLESKLSLVAGSTVGTEFIQAEARFGVRAVAMELSKALRNDGRATLRFAITGLSVLSGEVAGLRFYFESILGQVGRPSLDPAGFVWEDETQSTVSEQNFDSAMFATQERARKVAGIIRFPAPLKPTDPPLSFGLSIITLNTDALSTWEYKQLYSPSLVQVNGQPLETPTEYIGRVVWFPVETLKLSITLPSRTPGPAFPGFFLADNYNSIPREDVIRDQILQIRPPSDSKWELHSRKWQKQEADVLVQTGRFTRVSPQTWELTVVEPKVGSCYTLDWRLPASPEEKGDGLEEDTLVCRQHLLQHRNLRLRGENDERVRTLIFDLFDQIYSEYGGVEPNEQFSLSLLTYDQDDHRLKFVDGIVNGRETDRSMWDLWLPFGAGLGGACFKQQADNLLVYLAPEKDEKRTGPETYLSLPGQVQHSVLVAIPLTHPAYIPDKQADGFETPRLRIAVLDIGSDSKITNLRTLDRAKVTDLLTICRTFLKQLYQVIK